MKKRTPGPFEFILGSLPESERMGMTMEDARRADAARDLLEAVKHLMGCDFPDSIDFRCDGCNAARAAIAKAEGKG